MANCKWTKLENEIVLELFFLMSVKDAKRTTDPELIEVAEMIGKKPGSVWMKLENFLYLATDGAKGLSATTKDCREAWVAHAS